MIKVSLGKRIFQLRKQKNISQEQLAEAADYSVDFISLVERGINAPSVEGCKRLADALDVQVKDLFDFESNGTMQ